MATPLIFWATCNYAIPQIFFVHLECKITQLALGGNIYLILSADNNLIGTYFLLFLRGFRGKLRPECKKLASLFTDITSFKCVSVCIITPVDPLLFISRQCMKAAGALNVEQKNDLT